MKATTTAVFSRQRLLERRSNWRPQTKASICSFKWWAALIKQYDDFKVENIAVGHQKLRAYFFKLSVIQGNALLLKRKTTEAGKCNSKWNDTRHKIRIKLNIGWCFINGRERRRISSSDLTKDLHSKVGYVSRNDGKTWRVMTMTPDSSWQQSKRNSRALTSSSQMSNRECLTFDSLMECLEDRLFPRLAYENQHQMTIKHHLRQMHHSRKACCSITWATWAMSVVILITCYIIFDDNDDHRSHHERLHRIHSNGYPIWH